MKLKYRKLLKELEEATDHNDMLSKRVTDLSGNYDILVNTLAIRDEKITTLSETVLALQKNNEKAEMELSKLIENLDKFNVGGEYSVKQIADKKQEKLLPKVTKKL